MNCLGQTHKKSSKGVTLFLLVLLIGAIVAGYFGEKKVKEIGAICDFGFKDKLCWKWHMEVYDGIQKILEDARGTDYSIEKIINPSSR